MGAGPALPARAGENREATLADLRALAHPLRLRILRVCEREHRTNKEIAEVLGIDPATCLHHVRLLVDAGFLAHDDPRPGPRGSTEKPYRATGKTVRVVPPPDPGAEHDLAEVDAARDDILRAGTKRMLTYARLDLRLSPIRAAELAQRLETLVYEYAEAGPDPAGDDYGLFVVFHAADRRP